MSATKDTILITSGTGKVGTALVGILAAAAAQPVIRIATRDVNSTAIKLLKAMNPATVEAVRFDENDPASLEAAFEGVTKLCLIPPFGGNMEEWHRKVVTAAEAASCQYAVKVSVTGARSPEADPPPGNLPLAHWRGEEILRQSRIASTAIRPTIFMQHFVTVPGLFQPGEDSFYLPTGEAPIAFVDCRDIAAFAAALLLAEPAQRQPYENQAYELTGPAALTAAQLVEIIGWAAGRQLGHVDGEEAFVAHCQALGVADGVKFIYREAAGGWFAKPEYPGFTEITGRIPTSFAKFAADNAAHFRR